MPVSPTTIWTPQGQSPAESWVLFYFHIPDPMLDIYRCSINVYQILDTTKQEIKCRKSLLEGTHLPFPYLINALPFISPTPTSSQPHPKQHSQCLAHHSHLIYLINEIKARQILSPQNSCHPEPPGVEMEISEQKVPIFMD